MAVLVTSGCSRPPGVEGGPGAPPEVAATPATLSVFLVKDGADGALEGLNLAVTGLEFRTGGTWRKVPLAPGLGPVDLLGAAPDHPVPLATNVPWPDALSDGFRFTVGPGSTVALADGTSCPLDVPAMLTGTPGLPGSFSPGGKPHLEVRVVLDVAGRARPNADDPSRYAFMPGVMRAYDASRTGSIAGRVLDAQGQPLAGERVVAELGVPGDAPGASTVFRTAVTNDAGEYRLDLLPLDFTWCAVAQGGALAPGFTDALALGPAPFDTYSRDLACARVEAPGQVTGQVAPTGAPLDAWVDLVEDRDVGGIPARLVVQSAPVAPDGTFTFPQVPPGAYRAALTTCTYDPASGLLERRTVTASFQVAEGELMALNF